MRPRSDLIPNSSLWIGELEEWMDEPYLYQLFSNTEDLLRVNVIKDRKTGVNKSTTKINKMQGKSNGYGFVYFSNPIAAKNVLEAYNGIVIPNTNKRFRYCLFRSTQLTYFKIKLRSRKKGFKYG
jgi:RNA recognition motif-containing protein